MNIIFSCNTGSNNGTLRRRYENGNCVEPVYCDNFHFRVNGRCVSWWVLLGPLIAVVAVCIILLVTGLILGIRKKQISVKQETGYYNFECMLFWNIHIELC